MIVASLRVGKMKLKVGVKNGFLCGIALAAAAGVSPVMSADLKDVPQAGADGNATRGVWFSGVDVAKDAWYGFAGAIGAFNGDLSKDGLVWRLYGSHLEYDLNPGDGKGWQGDIMLGYVFNRADYSAGLYAGLDVQNFKLSPDDPTAKVRGTEAGLKISADIETSKETLPYYANLDAVYSTAFDTYWARGRLGLNRHGFTFGPEASAFGSVDFDAQRLGAFLSYKFDVAPHRPIEVTLSAGHQFVNDDNGNTGNSTAGGEGTYVGIAISSEF
jgi:hypothetical protein